MLFAPSRYCTGGMSHSAQPTPGFGNNGTSAISGNTMLFNSSVANPEGSPGGRSKFFTMQQGDTMSIFPLAAIAGADTVLTTCSINGTSASVICQTNTGGYIAAIIAGLYRHGTSGFIEASSTAPIRVVVNSTGTAPTAGNIGAGHWFVKSLFPIWADAVSTDIATARTLTIPAIPTRALVMAVSINDVSAANQCTWTGTAGNGEDVDGTLSTARRSFAQFAPSAGSSLTIISTYDVISTIGNSLAAAMFLRGS